ncbi:MAG: hypothetical protein U0990_04175 [Candidatus Nanopelagicales bacterium]|nr:hypothetical protein [Candidatus Nanopelagicales bacterium]
MAGINSLAITIVAGVISVVSLVAITALLLSGIAVPSEFWGLLGTSSGAAVLGGAVSQGAAIATNRNGGSGVR